MKFSALLSQCGLRLILISVVSLMGFLVGPSFAHAQTAPSENESDTGIQVDKPSKLRNLVPAEQLERAADKQFNQMKREAAQKNALARLKKFQQA